jgi:endoglycosylceramidase
MPVFLTEFGATDNASTIGTEMQGADKIQAGWQEWTYSGVGDITTSGDKGAESLVFDPMKPPTGDNVNTGNLAALAVPYPNLISGIPISYSFADGTFQFSYSTEKADGSGNFTPGSETVIVVPAINYPNGYHVSVTGGHVVSADTQELVVASDTGADTVTVIVSAAAEDV